MAISFVILVGFVILVSVILVVNCISEGPKDWYPLGTAILHTIQWTTRITETGITNLTRITNEMATSSDYLMKYFNGILAILLE